MPTETVRTGLVEANGTQLYHEIRGDGPPIVCITGASGDAVAYQLMAERLADTYTVVSYDRRGNSRSPKPDGWTATTIAEQADDCAALIEAVGLDRPVVFGNSSGGTILVGLLERHADALRGAIVHEPGLMTVAPSAAELAPAFEGIVSALAGGDRQAAWDKFGRLVTPRRRIRQVHRDHEHD